MSGFHRDHPALVGTDADPWMAHESYRRAHTAIVLENAKQWIARLCKTKVNSQGQHVINETTRSLLLGGYSDYIFPIIRAALPYRPQLSVSSRSRSCTAAVNCWLRQRQLQFPLPVHQSPPRLLMKIFEK